MADIIIINPRFETSYWGLEHAMPFLGIKAVLPVARQNAISAGSSPSDDSIDTMRKMPSGCTPEPAGASVPRMTR